MVCMAAAGCSGGVSTAGTFRVDSLNAVSYNARYKELERSTSAAATAYKAAGLYRYGKAEACDNLGFCAFMRMDFLEAERLHREVYSLTKNELELLVADIGMMRVCQRMARNKEFYDYRNSALRRMKRIDEESDLFTDRHGRTRLAYARSEFHLVSTVYHYYLQQRAEAIDAFRLLEEDVSLTADRGQWLQYHYLKGAASLGDGETPDERRLQAFDELYFVWRNASKQGDTYFIGNGLQGLAGMMAFPEGYAFFLSRRGHLLSQLGLPVDTLLPLRLGEEALALFRQYDDPYQVAGAYTCIGKYLNAHGHYSEALDTLDRAIASVAGNEASVPECVSRIHEQMSVAYAGLGMKEASDINRNVYLDILDETRQDREWESRYAALQDEERQLNLLLVATGVAVVAVCLFFWFFNRRSRTRNRLHLHRLRLMLDICQKITASIPPDAVNTEEIEASLLAATRGGLEALFGVEGTVIKEGRLSVPRALDKDEEAMARLLNAYIQWALENGTTAISLGDERRRLEKRRYVHELHIAGDKRQNLVKRACIAIVEGIHPYIDRIAGEVGKLTKGGELCPVEVRRERYQYMEELVTAINEYNDILSLWVKMRQGTPGLQIETFGLEELFDLLRKGGRAFELKGLSFTVEPTSLWVKADKALTLFMINTLAENARKYTDAGGGVKVSAFQKEDYVELSVTDTGYGLSKADVARIVGEKVYDSKAIGMDDEARRESLRQRKGSGFGLMNCRGIIEKYRKAGDLFKVCLFGVESTPGKGSRFFFRLPAGVRKPLSVLLLLLLPALLAGCGNRDGAVRETDAAREVSASQDTAVSQETVVTDGTDAAADSAATAWRQVYDALLDQASDYANGAYYSNVDRQYEQALAYIDSAMVCLNDHYARYASLPRHFMALEAEEEPAELAWWNEGFDSDYHVILDIRNEAAVAFLALKQWSAYDYNNRAYTVLYKLLGEDSSLEAYCRELERSTTNKTVGIWLFVLLFLTLAWGYYFLYFRRRLVYRWNLEQVLEINRQVFAASAMPLRTVEQTGLEQEEDVLQEIPQRIVDEAFDAVNELLGVDGLGLAVYGESTHHLTFAFNPKEAPAQRRQLCMETVRRCFDEGVYLSRQGVQAIPLVVEKGGQHRRVGVLCLERPPQATREADRLLLQLITRYMAIVVFNAVVKLAAKYRDIETAQDETRRASWEESQLHVQNMVLDNCLSTIKHETSYYPSKIKQLVAKLRAAPLTEAEERATIAAIGELTAYYKGIFTILSRQASRQLEEVTFRRGTISARELMEAAERYFRKAVKDRAGLIRFHTEAADAYVTGDRHLLAFLLESLIDEALASALSGDLGLTCAQEGAFVKFTFTDRRRAYAQDVLNRLFFPDLQRMIAGSHGALRGTEYLVCKQIVRDHDEYAGRRGCRVYAVPAEGGGFSVCFTLPGKGV
ncbi:MAG: DUF5112 domain-containing protein [Prevotellaceae bacterium]|nr:DUF5112 domain-containing protein [Prevotellaceae bacterium]